MAEPAPQTQEGSGRAAGADPGEVHALALSTFRPYLRLAMPEVLDPRQVTVWRPKVAPGEEAQVDVGFLGLWEDPRTGKRQRIWAFALVLSYSRHLFIRPVVRLDSLAWLACHVAAFGFREAVPKRTGCSSRICTTPSTTGPIRNRPQHYGVLLDPCRAGHPTDKPAWNG